MRPKRDAGGSLATFLAVAAAVIGAVGLVLTADREAEAGSPLPPNTFIGVGKCKSCHKSEAGGDQYTIWEKTGHAKAWETLGTDEAKRIAAEKGIDDPQKSDQCLKCHTTAFGEPADAIKRGFKAEHGVQCESCHGPGGDHMKARFAAAAKEEGDGSAAMEIAPGEMIVKVTQETCLKCHNEESPTFKPFCFQERAAKIRHLDPRREHPNLTMCGCGDDCGCVHGDVEGCAVPAKK